MGNFSAVRIIAAGLLFIVASSAALDIEDDVDSGEERGLIPDDICPCITREECPRVFGSEPEDVLLGSFTPCREKGAVRCCGVSTRVTVEHSESNSGGNNNRLAKKYGKNIENNGKASPVVPPGIVVPVSFTFPEYVDPRTTTALPKISHDEPTELYGYDDLAYEWENESGEEGITDAAKDSEDQLYREDLSQLKNSEKDLKLKSGTALRGENIDGQRHVSRTGEFLSNDYLDRRTVNKDLIRGGETQTNNEAGSKLVRGENSLSKRVESASSTSSSSSSKSSSSSSSSDKKIGASIVSIANDDDSSKFDSVAGFDDNFEGNDEELFEETEDGESKKINNEKIKSTAELDEEDNYYDEVQDSELSGGSQSFNKFSQNGVTHVDELLDESSSNGFNDNRFHRARTGSRGDIVTANQESSSQQNSEKASKESSTLEESKSSSFTQQANHEVEEGLNSRDGTVRAGRTRVSGSRRPTFNRGETVHEQRDQTSNSEKKSQSEKKESSSFQESSSTNLEAVATNNEELLEDGVNSEVVETSVDPVPAIRRPLFNRGRISHGQREQTSSQKNSQSEKKESSSVQESSSSNAQSTITNTDDLSLEDVNSEVSEAAHSPVSPIRKPTINRGRLSHGQREQTSSQKNSQSEKKESSSAQESSSSNAQSTITNTDDLSLEDVNSEVSEAAYSPVSPIRKPTINRGRLSHGQREQTSSQKNSQSEKKESSSVQESSSSNAQSTITNTDDLSLEDVNSEVSEAAYSPVSPIRKPTINRGRLSHGQREQTSSQKNSQSEKKESSSAQESSSSNAQSTITNTDDLSLEDVNSEVSEAAYSPVSPIRKPTINRGRLSHGQREQTSSQKNSQSEKKESSSAQESSSSNAQSTITNTDDLSLEDVNSEVSEAAYSPVSPIRKPTINRGRLSHGQREQTSSQKNSQSEKKESSSAQESSSSNAQSTITNTDDLSLEDVNSEVSEAAYSPVSPIRKPTINRGRLSYGQQQQTSSQKNSQSEKKESSSVQESSSSSSQNVSSNTGDLLQEDVNAGDFETALSPVPAIRRPIGNRGRFVNGRRQQTSSQRQNQSQSEKKESSSVKESTSSNSDSIVTNTGESHSEIPETTTSSAIRRPTLNRGNLVHGHRQQTSSQKNTQSEKKESSSFEENTSSNAQSVTTNTEHLSDDDVTPEIVEGSVIPVPHRGRRPALSRGKPVVGQRQQTSSEQKSSQSEKKESSSLEENSSSKIESLITKNTGDHLQEDVNPEVSVTTYRPPSRVRRPNGSRGRLVQGKQSQTSFQTSSQSEKKESSSVKESSSSKVESTVTNTENGISNNDATTSRLNVNQGTVSSEQQQETSSQSNTQSEKKESSSSQHSTSSNVESTVSELHKDENSNSEISIKPTSDRGDAIYGQQSQTFTEQNNQSEKKESSSSKQNTSSNSQSTVTNVDNSVSQDANLDHPDVSSIVDGSAANVQESVSSSSHQESQSSKQESSSVETSSSKTEESSLIGNANTVNSESTHVQNEQKTSTQETSESTSKESSSIEKNTSSNVNQVIANTAGITSNTETSGSTNVVDQKQSSMTNEETADHGTTTGQQTETSTNNKSESVSSESSSVTKESSSSTSNLINLMTGTTTSVGLSNSNSAEIENTFSNNPNAVWNIANRTYIPVLINAGFLRDRPTSTGQVGLDPLSGVTHSDIWDADVAPELLPLSCGNVVFGERLRDGKTLVCDMPRDNVSPIRLNENRIVSRGKLRGPILADAILPGSDNSRVDNEDMKLKASISSNAGESTQSTESTKVESRSMSSESRNEESSKSSTVDTVKKESKLPPRRRVVVKRPTVTKPLTTEDLREDVPRPVHRAYRGRGRQSAAGKESEVKVEESQGEVGSKQVAKESTSTSSSSSSKSSSAQESTSVNSKEVITKSEFEGSSAEEFDVEKESSGQRSKFYVLPLAPVLPHAESESQKVVEDHAAELGEKKSDEIVEVVQDAPASRTRINGKKLRNYSSGQKLPPNNLDVVNIKTSEDNGENVVEAEIVESDSQIPKRPAFFYRRKSRNANSLVPEVNRMNISPEELAMPGRVNVVGPIPKGYTDPAISEGANSKIELPNEMNFEQPRSNDGFKPSPVDPVKYE